MGYLTSFNGSIQVEPPLNTNEVVYLERFSETCRMNRPGGPYFVGDDDSDVECVNAPPDGQPGLWCLWTPESDGSSIRCIEEDEIKFYDASDWMTYLIRHFLDGSEGSFREHPDSAGFTFDHVANGVITAQGECCIDRWDLVVVDNQVTTKDYFSGIECHAH